MNDVLTPEQYEELLALGGDNAEIAAALEQMKQQAEMLRGRSALPQGGMAGRVYVPPSIFQYAASMANEGLAGRKEREIKAHTGKMLGNSASQNQTVMRAILGQGQPTVPEAPTMVDPYARFRRGMGGA